MKNLNGIASMTVYVKKLQENSFPHLENQKYDSLGDFSSEWNSFVFYESARAAGQIGYGSHAPLSFFNDILYAI